MRAINSLNALGVVRVIHALETEKGLSTEWSVHEEGMYAQEPSGRTTSQKTFFSLERLPTTLRRFPDRGWRGEVM